MNWASPHGLPVKARLWCRLVPQVDVKDTSLMPVRVPPLTDYFGFTVGTLSQRGAVYASPRTSSCPSTLVYRHFNSWATNSDWSVGLPDDDEAVCLAAGSPRRHSSDLIDTLIEAVVATFLAPAGSAQSQSPVP